MPFHQGQQKGPGNMEQQLLESLLGQSLQANDREIAETPLAGPQAEAQQVAGLFDFLSELSPFGKVSEALDEAAPEETRQRQRKARNRGKGGVSSKNRLRMLEEKNALLEKALRQQGKGQLAPPPTPAGQELPRGPAPQPSLEDLLPFLQRQA